MERDFTPNDTYMIINFNELETAWRMMAMPDKLTHLDDTLSTVRRLNQLHGPQKALFHMVSATAWLMADESTPDRGPGSGSG